MMEAANETFYTLPSEFKELAKLWEEMLIVHRDKVVLRYIELNAGKELKSIIEDRKKHRSFAINPLTVLIPKEHRGAFKHCRVNWEQRLRKSREAERINLQQSQPVATEATDGEATNLGRQSGKEAFTATPRPETPVLESASSLEDSDDEERWEDKAIHQNRTYKTDAKFPQFSKDKPIYRELALLMIDCLKNYTTDPGKVQWNWVEWYAKKDLKKHIRIRRKKKKIKCLFSLEDDFISVCVEPCHVESFSHYKELLMEEIEELQEELEAEQRIAAAIEAKTAKSVATDNSDKNADLSSGALPEELQDLARLMVASEESSATRETDWTYVETHAGKALKKMFQRKNNKTRQFPPAFDSLVPSGRQDAFLAYKGSLLQNSNNNGVGGGNKEQKSTPETWALKEPNNDIVNDTARKEYRNDSYEDPSLLRSLLHDVRREERGTPETPFLKESSNDTGKSTSIGREESRYESFEDPSLLKTPTKDLRNVRSDEGRTPEIYSKEPDNDIFMNADDARKESRNESSENLSMSKRHATDGRSEEGRMLKIPSLKEPGNVIRNSIAREESGEQSSENLPVSKKPNNDNGMNSSKTFVKGLVTLADAAMGQSEKTREVMDEGELDRAPAASMRSEEGVGEMMEQGESDSEEEDSELDDSVLSKEIRELACWTEQSKATNGRIDWAFVAEKASERLGAMIRSKEANPGYQDDPLSHIVSSPQKGEFITLCSEIQEALDNNVIPDIFETFMSCEELEKCSSRLRTAIQSSCLPTPPSSPRPTKRKRGRPKKSEKDTDRNESQVTVPAFDPQRVFTTYVEPVREVVNGQVKCLKQYHKIGDSVYFLLDLHDDVEQWEEAIVEGYRVVGMAYGEVRCYNVLLKETNERMEGIKEIDIQCAEEYEYLDEHGDFNDMKGVRHSVDPTSNDEYLRIRGWFKADGKEYCMACDAMRAHDETVVKKKGRKTRRRHLNYPDMWDFGTKEDIPVRKTMSSVHSEQPPEPYQEAAADDDDEEEEADQNMFVADAEPEESTQKPQVTGTPVSEPKGKQLVAPAVTQSPEAGSQGIAQVTLLRAVSPSGETSEKEFQPTRPLQKPKPFQDSSTAKKTPKPRADSREIVEQSTDISAAVPKSTVQDNSAGVSVSSKAATGPTSGDETRTSTSEEAASKEKEKRASTAKETPKPRADSREIAEQSTEISAAVPKATIAGVSVSSKAATGPTSGDETRTSTSEEAASKEKEKHAVFSKAASEPLTGKNSLITTEEAPSTNEELRAILSKVSTKAKETPTIPSGSLEDSKAKKTSPSTTKKTTKRAHPSGITSEKESVPARPSKKPRQDTNDNLKSISGSSSVASASVAAPTSRPANNEEPSAAKAKETSPPTTKKTAKRAHPSGVTSEKESVSARPSNKPRQDTSDNLKSISRSSSVASASVAAPTPRPANNEEPTAASTKQGSRPIYPSRQLAAKLGKRSLSDFEDASEEEQEEAEALVAGVSPPQDTDSFAGRIAAAIATEVPPLAMAQATQAVVAQPGFDDSWVRRKILELIGSCHQTTMLGNQQLQARMNIFFEQRAAQHAEFNRTQLERIRAEYAAHALMQEEQIRKFTQEVLVHQRNFEQQMTALLMQVIQLCQQQQQQQGQGGNMAALFGLPNGQRR